MQEWSIQFLTLYITDTTFDSLDFTILMWFFQFNDSSLNFYNQLASVLSGISRTYKLLLIGDFNERIGRDDVARGHGQTLDWEMQLQWRASTGSVL